MVATVWDLNLILTNTTTRSGIMSTSQHTMNEVNKHHSTVQFLVGESPKLVYKSPYSPRIGSSSSLSSNVDTTGGNIVSVDLATSLKTVESSRSNRRSNDENVGKATPSRSFLDTVLNQPVDDPKLSTLTNLSSILNPLSGAPQQTVELPKPFQSIKKSLATLGRVWAARDKMMVRFAETTSDSNIPNTIAHNQLSAKRDDGLPSLKQVLGRQGILAPPTREFANEKRYPHHSPYERKLIAATDKESQKTMSVDLLDTLRRPKRYDGIDGIEYCFLSEDETKRIRDDVDDCIKATCGAILRADRLREEVLEEEWEFVDDYKLDGYRKRREGFGHVLGEEWCRAVAVHEKRLGETAAQEQHLEAIAVQALRTMDKGKGIDRGDAATSTPTAQSVQVLVDDPAPLVSADGSSSSGSSNDPYKHSDSFSNKRARDDTPEASANKRVRFDRNSERASDSGDEDGYDSNTSGSSMVDDSCEAVHSNRAPFSHEMIDLIDGKIRKRLPDSKIKPAYESRWKKLMSSEEHQRGHICSGYYSPPRSL